MYSAMELEENEIKKLTKNYQTGEETERKRRKKRYPKSRRKQ